jgi:hypothetical protein
VFVLARESQRLFLAVCWVGLALWHFRPQISMLTNQSDKHKTTYCLYINGHDFCNLVIDDQGNSVKK